MPTFDEVETTNLLWTITTLVAAALGGAIIQHCVDALHRDHHPAHYVHNWLVRETAAWRKYRQRHR